MGLLWDWFGRAGPSGFVSSSTAEQVTDGLDATNLTAIVTGGTSGLGKETARVLAKRGAKVIIPARSMEGGLQVKENLLKENPDAEVEIMEMDLSSLRSVTSFARSFKSSNKHLNILINNAGIMACPFQLSVDGVELQFATNHLGHFFLTNLLLDKLKATAKETGIEGRIVNVSSLAHRYRNGFGIGFENFSNLSKIHSHMPNEWPDFLYVCPSMHTCQACQSHVRLESNQMPCKLKHRNSWMRITSVNIGLTTQHR